MSHRDGIAMLELGPVLEHRAVIIVVFKKHTYIEEMIQYIFLAFASRLAHSVGIIILDYLTIFFTNKYNYLCE